MSDKTYEMFWDCEYCGSSKLLGVTHRHCPGCGAAQDAQKRYFPSDEEKVAVEDHEFTGADWSCTACETPNSNKAEFCTNCGCGKDGAQTVDLKNEEEPKPAHQERQPQKSGLPIIPIVVGVVAIIAALLAVFFFWTEEKGVTVDSHSWSRSIDIERYQTVKEGDWQSNVPLKAYKKSCFEKKHSTKQVPDGETCSTKKKDNGDGSFREVEECKTKYKDVPVMKMYCNYSIDKWAKYKTLTEEKNDLKPFWPTTSIKPCSLVKLGCEKEGKKSERYLLNLIDSEGGKHECAFPQKEWKGINVGTQKKMQFRVVDGGIDCGSWND